MLSKLKEYLSLVPKLLNNPERIVQGIINDVKFNHGGLKEEEQEEIIRRRLICMNCPLNSTNANKESEYRELYGTSYQTERPDLHCSICACNIHWKTASLDEKCGLSYYNDLYPNRKQELKWDKFKPENNVE